MPFFSLKKIDDEIRLSIPFPYVVSRSPRFVHGGLKRGRRGSRGHSVNGGLVVKSILMKLMLVLKH